MTNRRGHSTWWRRGRLLAFIVLGIGLAYPVLANLFLAFGGVQKALEATDSVKVEFRRAWSIRPGRVHVEDLLITMQDRNVQFALRIPDAEVDIRLRDLAHRTFHATRVRANGISFRFRHRVSPEGALAPAVAAYPPVPGFSDPPLREAGPPTAPLDEEHYNLWTVHIEDVDAGIAEIWAQMFRYVGGGRVRGAFRLRPAKRLWVGPATLRLQGGTLTSGPHDVLRDFGGTLTCTVDDFDVEPVHGMDVFRTISARAKLRGNVAGLEVVEFLTAPSRPFGLTDGSGALDLDVALDHGTLTPDSWIHYRTGHAFVSVAKVRSAIDGELSISAAGNLDRPGGHVDLHLRKATLRLEGNPAPGPHFEAVHISLGTPSLDTTREWPFTGIEGRADGIALPDLRWLNGVPSRLGAQFVGGSARASGAVSISAHREVRGTVDVTVDHGQIRAGNLRGTASGARADVTWQGNAHGISGEAHARLRDFVGELERSRLVAASLASNLSFNPTETRGDLEVNDLRIADVRAGNNVECPWAKITRASFRGRFGSPPDELHDAEVRGVLETAALSWGSFATDAAHTEVRGQWEQTSASSPWGRLAADLEIRRLRFQNAGGPPRSWKAEIGNAGVHGGWAEGAAGLAGSARFEAENFAGQVGKTKLAAEARAELTFGSRGDTYRVADLAGELSLSKVAVTTANHEVRDWWAALSIRDARLDARQDFNLSGNVGAQFRDGLPALYVLASDDEIPAFTPALFPLQGLKLKLAIDRYCRMTDVRVLDANGGALSATGRVQVEPGETRGAVLVRLAALKAVSLGLDFVEDYSNTSLLAGQGWLDRQLAPLDRASLEKHQATCTPEPTKCR